jgi:hypothetical protein
MGDTRRVRHGVVLVALAAPMCWTTDEAQTPGCLQTRDGIID